MILTNPGGPGGSGLNFLPQSGDQIQATTGRDYDIVSWDPRGIGHSIPTANCNLGSESSTSRFRRRSTGGVPRIKLAEQKNSYIEATLQDAISTGLQCNKTIGGPEDAGPHMSTAVVARDMISILDAYSQTDQGRDTDSPHLLNYWGFQLRNISRTNFCLNVSGSDRESRT